MFFSVPSIRFLKEENATWPDPSFAAVFFDIQHVNPWNAQYWRKECRDWKEENWRALVASMHEIGLETLIAIDAALWGKPFFPGYEETVGRAMKLGCPDPLGVICDEADARGMRVFPGMGYSGRCSQIRDYAGMEPPWPEIWFRWTTAMAEALCERYGDHPCFAGLYIPTEMSRDNEAGGCRFLEHEVALYEKLMRDWIRPAVGPVPVLASPDYLIDPDLDAAARQFERMDVNIIAYQDLGGRGDDQGYGPAYPHIKKAADAYRKIKPIHEKTGVELGTNCELFIHVARPDGRSENLAGPIERILYQLETETEPADYVICYQYQGIMKRHTDLANIGHPGTQKLYDDCRTYLNGLSVQAS
ncbi:MAG: DUF4434 domain-containing protein [Candidatus Latescibacterota bacterium]